MTAMNFIAAWICQVDNRAKWRITLAKWVVFGCYLVTPENSQDNACQREQSEILPRYAATMKNVTCVALAFGLAWAISTLQ